MVDLDVVPIKRSLVGEQCTAGGALVALEAAETKRCVPAGFTSYQRATRMEMLYVLASSGLGKALCRAAGA